MSTDFLPPIPVEQDLLVANATLQGEIVYQNEAWGNVFGPPDKPWHLLSDQEQGFAAQYIKDAASGRLVTSELFLVRLPNWDQPLPVLLNFLPTQLPDPRGVLRVVSITITGEVLTEPTTWMLSQSQKNRMETLGRMTVGITHDFNNLLSGILGHAELMRRGNSVIPEDIAEHIRTIEQAATDGATLVKKMQQYVRHEKQTEYESVDISQIVDDASTLTKPYWYNEPRRQGISIDLDLNLEEVPRIKGAPSELRDVFVNLILNAVQAMPQGGTIAVTTGTDSKTGNAVVRVKDTGTGMTDRVRARLFEPLFTTKGKRGTGMGLAVSYGTVQEHGGDIAVETELGFGTTFILSFPPQVEEPRVEEGMDPATDSLTARIMVVDDEPMVRDVLSKLLTMKGHLVLEAGSGAEALEVLDDRTVDIVFTDQGMPEMNGRTLAGFIRKSYPNLPIVLLTGDTEAGEPDRDVSLVLSKPFKLEALEAAMGQLL